MHFADVTTRFHHIPHFFLILLLLSLGLPNDDDYVGLVRKFIASDAIYLLSKVTSRNDNDNGRSVKKGSRKRFKRRCCLFSLFSL